MSLPELPREPDGSVDWWTAVHQATRCGICGEPFTGKPGDAPAEVVDRDTGDHLIVHSEPCSYEHGDRYQLA